MSAIESGAAGSKPNFVVVECDTPGASKAHQINYAIEYMKWPPAATWLYIMDVDTRFRGENLAEIRSRIDAGQLIIQQHTHFLRGYADYGPLGKMTGAYQSRWTLAHEIPRISIFNATRLGVYHLVGHGLCINLAKLRELGGLTEEFPIEDIHLGYVSALRGEQVASCHGLEASDAADGVAQWWSQQYGWSRGVMAAPAYFRRLRDRGMVPTRFNYVQQVFAIWNYARWLLNSPSVWFALASSGVGLGLGFGLGFFLVYGATFAVSGWFFRRKGYWQGNLGAFVGYAMVARHYSEASWSRRSAQLPSAVPTLLKRHAGHSSSTSTSSRPSRHWRFPNVFIEVDASIGLDETRREDQDLVFNPGDDGADGPSRRRITAASYDIAEADR